VKSVLGYTAVIGYEIVGWATFVKLAFVDNYVYNWWNWIIAIPVDGFMGRMWPIYWGILRPLFGP
jgi:hypothetical protein